MSFRKMAVGTMLVLYVALGPWVGTSARAEYLIKFSHVVAPSSPKGRAADLFARRVNEELRGQVRVEVYPNSQLYSDGTVLNAIRLSGSTTTGIMAAPSLSKFVKFSNTLQAFDLPFLFNDIRDVHRLLDSPTAQKMISPLENKGLHALGFWDNGMKVFSIRAAEPLLDVPDDFRGKKFRIQASPVHAAMIRALGGMPVKLAFKEVFYALDKGVVDGQENAWSNIYSKKFHRVQDYITVSEHSYLGYLVVVSEGFWSALPEPIRNTLERIIEEVTQANRLFAAEADIANRRNIEQSGFARVVELPSEKRALWRTAAAPVEDRFRAQIGAGLLGEIHAVIGH